MRRAPASFFALKLKFGIKFSSVLSDKVYSKESNGGD
jgi:hypothetical protein